jgi:dihydroorotase (multifunctional complex type)
VTTVVDMPCTSLPPVTCAAAFDEKMRKIGPKAHVDYRFWGGVRGNGFERAGVRRDLADLKHRGVRSIKTYLVSGMDTFEHLAPRQLADVLQVAYSLGLRVGVHAEDRAMVLAGTAREQQGATRDDPLSYVRARSREAEAIGVETCVRLAEQTGASVHVVHLACARGLEVIRAARARGVRVTVETCPHYLAFTSSDLVRLGGVLKTAPVVKETSDREALWQGLSEGAIDMVATDHAPGQWPAEKQTGSIWSDYGGVPGVELLLTYLLSEGVQAGRITLARALQLVSEGPAWIHRLAGKGKLEVGYDADLVVFDPRVQWQVRALSLLTRQKYTPFEGVTFRGRVEQTYLRGELAFDRHAGVIGPPRGQHVAALDEDSVQAGEKR